MSRICRSVEQEQIRPRGGSLRAAPCVLSGETTWGEAWSHREGGTFRLKGRGRVTCADAWHPLSSEDRSAPAPALSSFPRPSPRGHLAASTLCPCCNPSASATCSPTCKTSVSSAHGPAPP